MSSQNQSKSLRRQANEPVLATSPSTTVISPARRIVDQALGHIARGDCQRALDLLAAAGRDPQAHNARGVCLLRLGRYDDAVQVLHGLVFKAGHTWMRPELPTAYKTNFATALLLAGKPAGCLEMLAEIKDQHDPVVGELRATIKRWERSLGFWRRLDWRLSRIAPANCQIEIDFTPGRFDVETTPSDSPGPGRPSPHLRTAA